MENKTAEPTPPTQTVEPPPSQYADVLRRDRDLQDHLKSLGLETVEQYIKWCSESGFSTKIRKNWKQRCKERFHDKQSLIETRSKHRKLEKRRPQEVVNQILTTGAGAISVETAWLKRIQEIAGSLTCPLQRTAFHELLIRAIAEKSEMLSLRIAHPVADARTNTFIDGLLSLSAAHLRWIRPLKDWQPKTKNPRRQFSSLVRHLVAKYPVPEFMDYVWFCIDPDSGQQLGWFLKLATGASLRKLELPLPVSKSMVKHFASTPDGLMIVAALRRSQVLACGGDRQLVKAVLESRLTDTTCHNPFWLKVIQWLVRHPMLSFHLIGPLIDYVFFQVFPDGDDRAVPREFNLRGRSPNSILADMHRWHASLRKAQGLSGRSWPPHPSMGGLYFSETCPNSGQLLDWTIQQILSVEQLRQEGQTLRHCVLSYARQCLDRSTAIWSMSLSRDGSKPRRVLTIEVSPDTRKIRQVRGRYNRNPKSNELAVIKRWANEQALN